MGTITVLLLAFAALTLLRLRFRFEIAGNVRRVFVGLGRSGVELDYVTRRQTFRLFGLAVKESDIARPSDPLEQESIQQAGETDEVAADPTHELAKPKRLRRVRPVKDILRIIPRCSQALWGYSIGLLKSIIVEELEAEIEGGFDSPDLTGTAFGYYQAALAAVPGVVGHVKYTPDWQGASFCGRARGSVALPLYRLILRSAALMWQLPLRDLIKLAIGKQRGGQDG